MSRKWFSGDLETVATFWRIDRRDGVTLGFTTHDADLWFDGLSHRASPGMVPSSIRKSAGFEADSAEVRGTITHEEISTEDLATGRFDGARVRIGLIDWNRWNAKPSTPARSAPLPRKTVRSPPNSRRARRNWRAIRSPHKPRLSRRVLRAGMQSRSPALHPRTGRRTGGYRQQYGLLCRTGLSGPVRWRHAAVARRAASGRADGHRRRGRRQADPRCPAGREYSARHPRLPARRVRSYAGHLRGTVRQCRELSRRTLSSRKRPAHPLPLALAMTGENLAGRRGH